MRFPPPRGDQPATAHVEVGRVRGRGDVEPEAWNRPTPHPGSDRSATLRTWGSRCARATTKASIIRAGAESSVDVYSAVLIGDSVDGPPSLHAAPNPGTRPLAGTFTGPTQTCRPTGWISRLGAGYGASCGPALSNSRLDDGYEGRIGAHYQPRAATSSPATSDSRHNHRRAAVSLWRSPRRAWAQPESAWAPPTGR